MLDVDPSLNFNFEMDTTNLGEPMDSTLNDNVCTSNNPWDDSLHDDHGLVDAHDFDRLQEQFDSLERSHNTLKENVTTLMGWVKTFIHNMSQNLHWGDMTMRRASVSIAPITRDVPLPMASTPFVGAFVGSIPLIVSEPCERDSSQLEHHSMILSLQRRQSTY